MKNLVTETPQCPSEYMRNMVLVKDRVVHLRGLGENSKDIRLSDYCKKEYERIHECKLDDDIPVDEFGEYMDYEDLLSNFYWACVGFAEVREKLKQYEEIGTVEEIKSVYDDMV